MVGAVHSDAIVALDRQFVTIRLPYPNQVLSRSWDGSMTRRQIKSRQRPGQADPNDFGTWKVGREPRTKL